MLVETKLRGWRSSSIAARAGGASIVECLRALTT